MNDRKVDQNEIKVMQSFVMLLLALGFILDSKEIIALQVLIFLLTIIAPILNPFILLYRTLIRPRGIIKPDWREDNMEAHRFASMIGFSISLAALVALIYKYDLLGWSLVWLILIFGVFALSGWCAGCFTYYMINKLGVSGFFKHAPISKKIPGTRPPKEK